MFTIRHLIYLAIALRNEYQLEKNIYSKIRRRILSSICIELFQWKYIQYVISDFKHRPPWIPFPSKASSVMYMAEYYVLCVILLVLCAWSCNRVLDIMFNREIIGKVIKFALSMP